MALLFVFMVVAAPAPGQSVSDPTTSRPRLTAEQRFELANTTGDGRLTLEQARLGYRSVARYFSAIDLAGRGYVTLDEVRTWQRADRDARRTARIIAEDPLRPRPALQRGLMKSEAATHETSHGAMIRTDDAEE